MQPFSGSPTIIPFIGRRERNQQDATNLMFIIKTLISTCFGHHYAHHQENKSVHCLIWCSALVVMAVVVWSWDACYFLSPKSPKYSHLLLVFTPYAAVHTLVLLMMGIMMPETCWGKSLIINIRLVTSCWLLSLHPTFMMHGHKSLKYTLHLYLSMKGHICVLVYLTSLCKWRVCVSYSPTTRRIGRGGRKFCLNEVE
jgi:hypothetical protein